MRSTNRMRLSNLSNLLNPMLLHGRFWEELGEVFKRLGKDGDIKVIVLASSFPKYFTAGLDRAWVSIALVALTSTYSGRFSHKKCY